MQLEEVVNKSNAPPMIPSRSFRAWRQSVIEAGDLPIITVVGSRGKTTIVRLLAACLSSAGYQTAIRTNHGVEIDGVIQPGELGPWKRVEKELRAGSLDVAIREVDWTTAATLGMGGKIPFIIVSNICANRDECAITPDAQMARRAIATLLPSVASTGTVVYNGEDLEVAAGLEMLPSLQVLVGRGLASPRVHEHFAAGGTCAWLDAGTICVGSAELMMRICHQSRLGFALGGAAGFEVQNALLAVAAASTLGVRVSAMGNALTSFHSSPRTMPGSFNTVSTGNGLAIVDRPAPSWFLRPVLRGLRDFSKVRLISVLGQFDGIPSDDLVEIGRLIGRQSSVVLLHNLPGNDETQIELVREGIAKNELPPIVMTLPSETQAISTALTRSRLHDCIYVMTDRPKHVARQVMIHARRMKRHTSGPAPRADISNVLLFRPWSDHNGSTFEP
jgi:cyanophycin synthetase